MSSLHKPVAGIAGTAVDPSNPFGGTSGVLIDPITELTQPGGPYPSGTAIITDGLGGYTFGAVTGTPRHIIEFSTVGGVSGAGTRYLDRNGIAVTSVPVLLPAAATLKGITITVDVAPGGGRTYEVRVIADPGGANTLIGLALALVDPAVSARRRDLNAAIGDGILWGVSIVRTVGAGASAFTEARVEVEIEMP